MSAAVAKWLVRFRGWVIAGWAAVALLLAPRASHVQEALVVRGAYERATGAARAKQLITEAFPGPIADYVALVVQGPVAVTHPRYDALLDTLTHAIARKPYVTQVFSLRTLGDSVLVSRDRRTTFLIAALAPAANDDIRQNLVPDLRAALRDALARTPESSGFDVKVTGQQALDYDVRTVSAEDAALGERRVVPLTLLVLIIAFGALVAAVLPVLIGMLAITISLGLVTLVAQWTAMSVFVLNIATMVGLGVGIDYSLLIVTRFREEMSRGLSARDAAVRTIQTAGVAVLTSGLTVVVGFAALLTTPLSETKSVGLGGLIVVGVAVLLAVSLLPALLAILGRQIDRPRWLARPLARVHAPTGWERWARWLGRRPWRAIAIGGSIIALCSYPLVGIRFGLPAANWFPPGTESGQGLAALRQMGAAGVITPVRVVVQLPQGETALAGPRLRGLKALSDSLRGEPRVSSVRGVATVRPGLSALQLFLFYSDPQAVRDRYPEFFNAYLSADGRTTLIDVIPADTVGFTGMMDLARRVRALAQGSIRGLDRAEIVVGGFAATSVDLQDELLADLPSVVGLILATTALMLFIAFRSLLVPLKAVLLNCLSVGAAFGLTVLVFQEGLGAGVFGLEGPTEAIFVVVPVLVFATVFGLSMDYEVFLLARIKEVFDHTGRNDHATMEGLSATASVITFAAVIMVLVFGVFAFSRVLAVQFIGFGLAIAVLLDATIIRMILVPAIMHIAGRWNWWPGVRGHVTEPEE
ncbi:MAG TPA: MMPL family transporter [Gemmatimonadales bacterium]|nr:MMPL family transporter [Gemmatimonadales bacterium]